MRADDRYNLGLQPAAEERPAWAPVKFNLIDRIESLGPERITAFKYVSLAEEYLADHFPTFPVLPGVMMLEAMTQAAGWLLHARRDFGCSMAVLREARNVRYGRFVAPGNWLKVEVELARESTEGALFKATGLVGAEQALSARIELAYFNLADRQADMAAIDQRLREHHRRRWALIAPAGAAVKLDSSSRQVANGVEHDNVA
jgi:3-hydroxyacyl-[acyl-carrier-protein] dehydratase